MSSKTVTEMVQHTVTALIEGGIIQDNTYAICFGDGLSTQGDVYEFIVVERPDARHTAKWYTKNAQLKFRICAELKQDSLVVAAVNPGVLVALDTCYPFGGGVYSAEFFFIVATSGGSEDDDILVSRMTMEIMRKLANEAGRRAISHVRSRIDEFETSERHDDDPQADYRFLEGEEVNDELPPLGNYHRHSP